MASLSSSFLLRQFPQNSENYQVCISQDWIDPHPGVGWEYHFVTAGEWNGLGK